MERTRAVKKLVYIKKKQNPYLQPELDVFD